MRKSSAVSSEPDARVKEPAGDPLWNTLASETPNDQMPLEEALCAEGIKTPHIRLCVERKNAYGGNLADVIQDIGIGSQEVVARAMARDLGVAYFSPTRIDDILLSSWPEEVRDAADHQIVPLAMRGNDVMAAVSHARDITEARNRFYPGLVVPVVASEQTIQAAFRKLYANTHQHFLEACAADSRAQGYYKDILDAIIRHACYTGVSDIHFTPADNTGLVQLRVDGTLQALRAFPRDTYSRLVGVIRHESNINDLLTTAEAAMEAPGELAERYHLRVQVSRSVRGDAAVIRLLDQQGTLADFDSLGFDEVTARHMRDLAHASAGLVLITGPTGSGKTTTLYSMLRLLDPIEVSIQSVENPVEYQCGAWKQFEIRRGSGKGEGEEWLGWFKGLLRNDLDVALLGEVRDHETAKAAVEMANTGHLVFTTLHTNSATRAITRLSMMGLDMPALADVIIGITGQRLVRKLCPACKVADNRADTMKALEAIKYDDAPTPYREGEGCPECGYTRYKGRQMVYELLRITTEAREQITHGASGADLLRLLPPERRMWGVGLSFVARGTTSIDELRQRVIQE